MIGRLRPAEAESEDGTLLDALAMLIRCKQSSRMQYEHSMEGSLGLKLWSDENAHMLLLEENLPAVFELLAPGSFREIAESSYARRIRESAQYLSSSLDLSGQPAPGVVALVRDRCAALFRRDLTLTNRLLELMFEAIADTRTVGAERPYRAIGARATPRLGGRDAARVGSILRRRRLRPGARAAAPLRREAIEDPIAERKRSRPRPACGSDEARAVRASLTAPISVI